ncbi:hypothetical protein ACUXV3_03845 [Roseobacteraceae bacterium NS-SX3]
MIGLSQPNHDFYARCSEVSAERAKGFPKAAIQQAVAVLADAAHRSNVSEAQEAPFANSAV